MLPCWDQGECSSGHTQNQTVWASRSAAGLLEDFQDCYDGQSATGWFAAVRLQPGLLPKAHQILPSLVTWPPALSTTNLAPAPDPPPSCQLRITSSKAAPVAGWSTPSSTWEFIVPLWAQSHELKPPFILRWGCADWWLELSSGSLSTPASKMIKFRESHKNNCLCKASYFLVSTMTVVYFKITTPLLKTMWTSEATNPPCYIPDYCNRRLLRREVLTSVDPWGLSSPLLVQAMITTSWSSYKDVILINTYEIMSE